MQEAKGELSSLAVRLREGERSAAVELIDIYYKQIYLFMRRLGHSRQTSEDLTQETFMRAWQHAGQLISDKALTGWLYRIAANRSRLYWRRNRGSEATETGFSDEVQDNSEVSKPNGNFEELGLLKTAVGKLPMKLRQAVVLHYMQQLSISEAAQAAGVREGTFKSRLHRALNALRDFMSQKNFHKPDSKGNNSER